METTLHSHLISMHIQERIAMAQRERAAREVRRPREPRLRLHRLTAPTPVHSVGAGPA